MLCDAVISITVQYGTDNEELLAGSEALGKKYAGRKLPDNSNLLFINIVTDATSYEVAIEGWLKLHLTTLVDMVKQRKNLGMYWAIHGNMTETKPSLKELVAETLLLYKMGLKFVKINLSACWSAGPEYDNSKSKTFDYSTSMLSEFCKGLSTQGPKDLLDGLMVAGYQSCIVMYDSADDFPYFVKLRKNGKNAFDPKLTGGGVRNTFVKFGSSNSGKYQETHPKALLTQQDLADLNKYGTDTTRLAELDKIARKKKDEIKEWKELGRDLPKAPQRDNYAAIERYVLQKWVLRYSAKDNNWTRVSLANYTDHQNIRDMIQVVPDTAIPDKHRAFILPG